MFVGPSSTTRATPSAWTNELGAPLVAAGLGPAAEHAALGSEEWARTYATYRNTIEGTNGYLKDTAHESLAAPGRRRVRGTAAQSIFAAVLTMAANIRKIETHRRLVADGAGGKVGERARRRRMSLKDHLPSP